MTPPTPPNRVNLHLVTLPNSGKPSNAHPLRHSEYPCQSTLHPTPPSPSIHPLTLFSSNSSSNSPIQKITPPTPPNHVNLHLVTLHNSGEPSNAHPLYHSEYPYQSTLHPTPPSPSIHHLTLFSSNSSNSPIQKITPPTPPNHVKIYT